MTISEQELISRINAGDTNAFTFLFGQYHRDLFRFAWHLVHSSEVAEDLLQNVFLKIWQNRTEWHPKGSLKSYLYRATKNAALNHLRDEKTHRDKLQQTSNLISHEMDPESELAKSETENQIRSAIDTIPETCRTVFILSRYENLKYREIAEVLDISIKTVENHMGRALKLLKEKLHHLVR